MLIKIDNVVGKYCRPTLSGDENFVFGEMVLNYVRSDIKGCSLEDKGSISNNYRETWQMLNNQIVDVGWNQTQRNFDG